MPELKHRMESPNLDIAYQEIHLPNDQDFGTGTFRFQAKPNTLTPPAKPEPKAVMAIALNPPRLQISVCVNPGTKEVPVLLGRADGSPPSAQVVFMLPARLDAAQSHCFEAGFQNWQVVSFLMDGTSLPRKDFQGKN